ncbi:hypothetical protein AArcCO_2145 [Halalkaliarchaeum sp. AArc-CO]|nr:hypothetical protein AArcCO_2145 [Halalkaliarchaeum sp. AArc-CO]
MSVTPPQSCVFSNSGCNRLQKCKRPFHGGLPGVALPWISVTYEERSRLVRLSNGEVRAQNGRKSAREPQDTKPRVSLDAT